MDNLGQLGIGGTLTNHKRAEILVLMVGLKLAKDEGLPNLLVEGDSAIVIYWVNKERSSWQFDEWLFQNFSSNLFFFLFSF